MRPHVGIALAALLLSHAASGEADARAALTLRAHYVLDAPHPPATPTDVSSWIDDVVDEALGGETTHRDLFMHGGPGPAGLEWNGDADLLLLATGPASEPPPSLSFSVGGPSRSARVQCQATRCVGWAVVEGAEWVSRLRRVRASDAALGLPSIPDVAQRVLAVRATGRWSGRRFVRVAAFGRAAGE